MAEEKQNRDNANKVDKFRKLEIETRKEKETMVDNFYKLRAKQSSLQNKMFLISLKKYSELYKNEKITRGQFEAILATIIENYISELIEVSFNDIFHNITKKIPLFYISP